MLAALVPRGSVRRGTELTRDIGLTPRLQRQGVLGANAIDAESHGMLLQLLLLASSATAFVPPGRQPRLGRVAPSHAVDASVLHAIDASTLSDDSRRSRSRRSRTFATASRTSSDRSPFSPRCRPLALL